MHEECCLSHPIITEAIGESGDDPRRFVSENPVLVDDVIADVRKNIFVDRPLLLQINKW